MSLDAILISLLFFLLAFAFLFQRSKSSGKFPPGPRRLPIVGNLLQLGKHSLQTLTEWSKKYGDILGLQLGPDRIVILSNPAHIKEAWNNPVFNGRPMNALLRIRNDGEYLGVAFSEGNPHLEQRRFVLKNLRDLGFGKKSMESLVMTEINEIITTFSTKIDQNGGKSAVINTRNLFNSAILNALWHIVTGRRYAHDDPELKKIADGITQVFLQPKKMDILMQFIPVLVNLVVKFPTVFDSALREFVKNARNLLGNVIREERETHEEGVQRHFIDVYLEQIRNCEDQNSSFFKNQGDKNLDFVMLDLLVAGSETTSSTLTWAFLLLARHPKAQEELYKEILEKVGTSRPVSRDDRSSLIYLEAVVMETLRFSSLTPLGLPHRVTENVEFHGYKIPKNTVIFANQYAVNRSPEIWSEPDEFKPQRFLSKDGKSIARNEFLLAFGGGKRVCLGESLAREELYLFIGNLVQRFKWSVNPEEPIPSLESSNMSNPTFGLRLAQSHTLRISHRLNA